VWSSDGQDPLGIWLKVFWLSGLGEDLIGAMLKAGLIIFGSYYGFFFRSDMMPVGCKW
jgi:hypothetical protein